MLNLFSIFAKSLSKKCRAAPLVIMTAIAQSSSTGSDSSPIIEENPWTIVSLLAIIGLGLVGISAICYAECNKIRSGNAEPTTSTPAPETKASEIVQEETPSHENLQENIYIRMNS